MTSNQQLDLDAIEARKNAATPGPWSTHEDWPGRVFSDDSGYGHVARCTGSRGEADAEFTAHAREDVEELVDEVRRLRARVAELEEAGTYARSALAALCYDLEDPGSNAFGALCEISRATTGVEAPRDDAAQALARHDAQVMRRCAEFVRDTYSGEWADDAAATLERDADITERGCPGFEKEYQGVSDAKRRLANCKHCGKPRTTHPAARSAAV